MSTSEVKTPAATIFWNDLKELILGLVAILATVIAGGWLGFGLAMWEYRHLPHPANGTQWVPLADLGIAILLCFGLWVVETYVPTLFDRQYGGIEYGAKNHKGELKRQASSFEESYRKFVNHGLFQSIWIGAILAFFVAFLLLAILSLHP